MTPGYRAQRAMLLGGLISALGCRTAHVIASDGETDGATSTGSASGVPTGSDSSATGTGDPACQAPTGHQVCDHDGDPFHVLGLDCEGTSDDSVMLAGTMWSSPDASAWSSAREYGNATYTAHEGSNLLVLSTGTLPAVQDSGALQVPSGQVDAADGDNQNPDDSGLPEPVSTAFGSNSGRGGTPYMGCDGVGDCSDTLAEAWQDGELAHDLLWFRFDVVVPEGVHGYEVDLAWLSAEYAQRELAAGDMFVLWSASERFTGNVATLHGAPMTASGLGGMLATRGDIGDDPALQGTGFQGTTGQPCETPWASYELCPRGASTGWMTLAGPANPGETLALIGVLFDRGDRRLDTNVVLDNWRWSCAGCVPGSTCGLSY